MRSGLSQAQEQALMRPVPGIMPPPAVAPAIKEIPYDYVAKFALQGRRGNRVQDVINISVEGAFVAVAIGYSFIPGIQEAPTIGLLSTTAPNIVVNNIGIGGETFPLNLLVAMTQPTSTRTTSVNAGEKLVQSLVECLLVHLCGIDFKYSIVDSGTGRELQNQPIHNIAGLGEATGDRPFRPLAKPMLFMPRSTIRIEVEEISEGLIYTGAELFIVLHGYKALGYGTALP